MELNTINFILHEDHKICKHREEQLFWIVNYSYISFFYVFPVSGHQLYQLGPTQ
jgi:hypothetical protein